VVALRAQEVSVLLLGLAVLARRFCGSRLCSLWRLRAAGFRVSGADHALAAMEARSGGSKQQSGGMPRHFNLMTARVNAFGIALGDSWHGSWRWSAAARACLPKRPGGRTLVLRKPGVTAIGFHARRKHVLIGVPSIVLRSRFPEGQ